MGYGLPWATPTEVYKICQRLIAQSGGSQPQPSEKVKACPLNATLDELCLDGEDVTILKEFITNKFVSPRDIIKIVTSDGALIEGILDLSQGFGILSCYLEDGHHHWDIIGEMDSETGDTLITFIGYSGFYPYEQ